MNRVFGGIILVFGLLHAFISLYGLYSALEREFTNPGLNLPVEFFYAMPISLIETIFIIIFGVRIFIGGKIISNKNFLFLFYFLPLAFVWLLVGAKISKITIIFLFVVGLVFLLVPLRIYRVIPFKDVIPTIKTNPVFAIFLILMLTFRVWSFITAPGNWNVQ